MRIERIELDGFGRFHDAHWPLDAGLTVLLGANEAGKTTLLNALRALLFGFEATRDGRTWYPALGGGRRGGRLVLQTVAGERWTVERHGERGGGGALAVRAPNGNQGGQETLDRLLHGADRDLFNNIFAFGLGELQTFASLSAEGVRGRIYGAGAGLGGTSAIDLERRLRQQLDATFLPRGSQRPLNALLARIEELRATIADLARQPEEHEAAHRERAVLQARSRTLRDDVHARRERIARLARLRDAGPAAAELSVVDAELSTGDAALDTFPEGAVAAHDRRIGEIAEARATLAALDEQRDEALRARAGLHVDERLLRSADEISALAEERAARAGLVDRRHDLAARAATATAAVTEQLTRAGGWPEARLLALDDSIAVIESTRANESQIQLAASAAAEALQRRRSATDELERREAESTPGAGGGDVDFDARSRAVEELDVLRVRRAAAEALAGRPTSAFPALSPALLLAVAAALVAGGALVGLTLGAPVPGGVIGGVTAALLWLAARGSPPAGVELARLDAERGRLFGELGLAPTASDAEVRQVAADLATARARLDLAAGQRAGLDERRADLERRARDAETAGATLATVNDAWASWLAAHGLPVDASPEAARQLLAAAGAARRAASEREALQERLIALERDDQAFAARADALVVALGLEAPIDAARREAVIVSLATQLDEARAERRRCHELDATLARLDERRGPAAALVAERESAAGAALASLGCTDADALRARAAASEARHQLRARAREIRERLAGIAGSVEAIGSLVGEALALDPDQLDADRAEAEEDLARLEAEDREALNRIGALDARIAQLEATDEIGTRRQELAALEGQAAALAREWAVRAVALRLLEETRSRYERERQPDVVRAAEAHFERITGGRYSRIVAPPGDASVRVETEGGEGRVTDELSRGTAEQLYLALRFGLIEEFASHAEALPVVMDDVLVNFDADRAERAASAIRELSTRHQVLYFTCHPWTAGLLDPGGGRTVGLD